MGRNSFEPGPYRYLLNRDGLTEQTFTIGKLSGYELAVPDSISRNKRHDLTELRSMFNWHWQVPRQRGALAGIRLTTPPSMDVSKSTGLRTDRFASFFEYGFNYDEPTLRARRIARELPRVQRATFYEDIVHRTRTLREYAEQAKQITQSELQTLTTVQENMHLLPSAIYLHKGPEQVPTLVAQFELPDGIYLAMPIHHRELIQKYASTEENEWSTLKPQALDALGSQLPVQIAATEQLISSYESLESAFSSALQDDSHRIPFVALREAASNLFNIAVAIDTLPMDTRSFTFRDKRNAVVFWLTKEGFSVERAQKAAWSSSEEELDAFLAKARSPEKENIH